MLCQVGAKVHEVIHARAPAGHLQHFVAFRFYQTHLAYAEISLAQTDLSQTAALLFQMYSLSKDIYDKRVLYTLLTIFFSFYK